MCFGSCCGVGGAAQVVVCEATVQAAEAARRAARSLWRVSSTIFVHAASDRVRGVSPLFACPFLSLLASRCAP